MNKHLRFTSFLPSHALSLLFFFVLSASSLFFVSCYYTEQGVYLLDYTYSAKNIDSLIREENLPEDTRTLLQNTVAIQSFAQQLGLNISKKYKTYKELDRTFLVAVVQAADKLSISPYTWNYPFMGKLPYRGYFNENHATKEAKRLQKKDYDVLVRKVSAFSTLNILPDPVYSFMSGYSEYDLAETLIHEQVHSTIWVKAQSSFNEQLANFIAEKAALQYIIETYGYDSPEYTNIEIQNNDYRIFQVLMHDIRDELEIVYENDTLTREEKLEEKQKVLEEYHRYFQAHYQSLFQNPKRFEKVRIDTLNNAYFALLSIYQAQDNSFELAYERCNEDLIYFIEEMKPIISSKKDMRDPYGYLNTIPLSSQPSAP